MLAFHHAMQALEKAKYEYINSYILPILHCIAEAEGKKQGGRQTHPEVKS